MAADIFLKFEGGPDGESTDGAHIGWLELLGFNWGVTQQTSGSVSSQGSLSAARADFQNFGFTKMMDKASSVLVQDCASGKHYPKATIQVHRAGETKELYQEYVFTDVLLTGYNVSGASGNGDVPVENGTFAYGKAEWKYIPTKVAGGKGSGEVPGSWDLKLNAKS